MFQINANINKLKNQIQHDLIDINPNLEKNLTITLNNSNSARLPILKRTQTDRGCQYRQLISLANILIINLRARNNLLGHPRIINDV